MLGVGRWLMVVSLGAGFIAVAACGGQSESGDTTAANSDAASGGAAGSGNGSGGTGNEAGSTAATGGTFSTQLPPDTVLGGLGEEEFLALCEAAADYTVDVIQGPYCDYAGAAAGLAQGTTDAEIQTICTGIVAWCQATELEQPTCSLPDEPCDATAGEMDACLQEIAEARDMAADLIPSCAELTASTELPDQQSLPLGITALPACLLLDSKCPGILTDAGVSGSVPGTGGTGP